MRDGMVVTVVAAVTVVTEVTVAVTIVMVMQRRCQISFIGVCNDQQQGPEGTSSW